jgi:hypothetical protein
VDSKKRRKESCERLRELKSEHDTCQKKFSFNSLPQVLTLLLDIAVFALKDSNLLQTNELVLPKLHELMKGQVILVSVGKSVSTNRARDGR